MDFSRVKNITIPEGTVAKIMSGSVLLWQSNPYATLYNAGDQCISATGGWTNTGWTYNVNTIVSSTISSTHMTVTGGYSTPTGSGVTRVSIVGTENKINIDNISKIYADIEITSMGQVYLGVTDTTDAFRIGNFARDVAVYTGQHTLEIDVSSLTGEYYVVLLASGDTAYGRYPSANITKVWTE